MNIVVLDDSKTVLFTIQILLEEAGIPEEAIHLFSEGKKALSFIESSGADIIFSDIQMPEMDGFEFAEKLLKLSPHHSSILHVVSADEDPDDTERMKRIGVKHFIQKPINAQHFTALIAPIIADYHAQNKESTTVSVNLNNSHETAELFSGEDLSSIDHEEMARQIGIGSKHIPRLIESFVTESMSQLERLKEASAMKNYPMIEQCAHSIKGSAGNLQFNALYELARSIELAARAADETFPYDACRKTLKKSIMTIPCT